MNDPLTQPGCRVIPSGAGRTAPWPPTPGTVMQQLTPHSVEVIWDGTRFGDEMDLNELLPATGAGAKPPAAPPTDSRLLLGNTPR